MFRNSMILLALALAPAAVAQDDADGSVVRVESMSNDELSAYADTAVSTIRDNAEAIGEMLDQEDDPDVKSCLRDQATAANALKTAAEPRAGEIKNLVAGGEVDKARTFARMLRVFEKKSNEARANAGRCEGGGGQASVGTTTQTTGGTGDDSDTSFGDELDGLDINVNPPQVSEFVP
jgi:hypothetical protein